MTSPPTVKCRTTVSRIVTAAAGVTVAVAVSLFHDIPPVSAFSVVHNRAHRDATPTGAPTFMPSGHPIASRVLPSLSVKSRTVSEDVAGTTNTHPSDPVRRCLLRKAVSVLSASAVVPFLAGTVAPSPAQAANRETKDTLLFLQTDNNSGSTAAKLPLDVAKQRFVMARNDLQYLLDHYADIATTGGGDAVRNYLGTQGVNSGMYGIQKVLKRLQQEADDIVEYTESMEEFNAYLYQAEGAAYQSLFAQHSSAKSTPESLLATAKQDVIQMVKYMNQLAAQLNI